MNYDVLHYTIQLNEKFDNDTQSKRNFTNDIDGFKKWFALNEIGTLSFEEPDWEGKKNGRSADSIINTLIVHLNRYARTYSRAAILGSEFSTQDDYVYLIILRAFGPMSKSELIRKNIQDKPGGIQIINRLIHHKWIVQRDSQKDKRSKIIQITENGIKALDEQMDKIRQATKIVAGNLTHFEKMELIRLLKKLNNFHHPIYEENIENENLLQEVTDKHLLDKT